MQGWWAFPSVQSDDADWTQLIIVREAMRKELEGLRTSGGIGSSLQAEVSIAADGAALAALKATGDELRFWLQTSAVKLVAASEGLKVAALASPHAKCDRCWHYREDVGTHAGHEIICGRCVSNIEGPGETRRYF